MCISFIYHTCMYVCVRLVYGYVRVHNESIIRYLFLLSRIPAILDCIFLIFFSFNGISKERLGFCGNQSGGEGGGDVCLIFHLTVSPLIGFISSSLCPLLPVAFLYGRVLCHIVLLLLYFSDIINDTCFITTVFSYLWNGMMRVCL